jgi:pimeloyl-ACP methyl ester carboxylesterase
MRLPRSTAPALILHGEDNRLAPVANAALLAERIPGAALRRFLSAPAAVGRVAG